MALFDPTRHYPLLQLDWHPDTVQQTISEIAHETITQLKTAPSLSSHPMDDQGSFGGDLYFGKAGVLWAIHYLQTVGAIETTFDVASHLEATLSETRQHYAAGPYPEQSSYLFGDLPLLLLQYKLSPTEDKAEQILQAIHKNDTQPVRELMWGIAGSMLAAYFMHQWTQAAQWQAVFKSQAALLLQEWQPVDKAGYLWTIDLYGRQRQ